MVLGKEVYLLRIYFYYLDEIVRYQLYDKFGWSSFACPTSGLTHMLRKANEFTLSIDLVFNSASL